MRCGEWNVSIQIYDRTSQFSEPILTMIAEALVRITGAYPAFMRPRELLRSVFLLPLLILLIFKAYGNYNNLVREAAAARGQTLAVWDFE
jgi:hypothetical protein